MEYSSCQIYHFVTKDFETTHVFFPSFFLLVPLRRNMVLQPVSAHLTWAAHHKPFCTGISGQCCLSWVRSYCQLLHSDLINLGTAEPNMVSRKGSALNVTETQGPDVRSICLSTFSGLQLFKTEMSSFKVTRNLVVKQNAQIPISYWS